MHDKRKKVILKDILEPKGYIRGPFGSALKRGELLDKGIPVYEQQHAITNSRTFRFFINNEKFETMKRFQVKDNDLIISCSGTVGCVSIIGPDDPKGIISQALLILRANTDIVLPQYLKYFFASREGYNAIVSRSSGSVQVNISKREIIEQIEIDLPDIPTQRKIVKILESLDDKIAINKKINDNLQQQVTALFRSWFVDFAPFGGAMPISWNISSLGETTEMGAGGDKPKITSPIKTSECPYPIFSNSLSDYGLYGYTNEAKIYVESVTVSARGTIGFVCLRHVPYVPIVRLVTLIPKRKFMSAKYLYLYLRQLNISGTGTTQQQLTVPDFRKTEIIIPDKDTMTAFTELITPMFEKMWENEEENYSLAKTRDTLLPKLMSGEIDVSDI